MIFYITESSNDVLLETGGGARKKYVDMQISKAKEADEKAKRLYPREPWDDTAQLQGNLQDESKQRLVNAGKYDGQSKKVSELKNQLLPVKTVYQRGYGGSERRIDIDPDYNPLDGTHRYSDQFAKSSKEGKENFKRDFGGKHKFGSVYTPSKKEDGLTIPEKKQDGETDSAYNVRKKQEIDSAKRYLRQARFERNTGKR